MPRADRSTDVAISALEHHLYCPRQCALIHVDGLWVDSADTVRGEIGHRRVDLDPSRVERGTRVVRHLPLWSDRVGLVGRADAVLIDAGGAVTPVEYKIGTDHGAAPRVQLCAQALCLEEMLGTDVREGLLWLTAVRRRVRVRLDDELRSRTLDAIADVRSWLASETLPPAPDDARCRACQLLQRCLPSLSAHPGRVEAYIRESTGCVC